MELSKAIRQFDERLLTLSEGRRELTKYDPLLFAMIYLPHHLRIPGMTPSVCDFHLDLIEWAKGWTQLAGRRKEQRACFIAPRQSGKSTWVFLILPLWAAAHGHRTFVAAFSDSETQAMTHLHSVKMELGENQLLAQDFPELVEPAKASKVGRYLMHNRNQIMQSNGFIFMAKGADSAALGMKVGQRRPDVLLFDDIEPGESNYSELEARKRRETLLSDLFPLNDWAVVGIVGTTTMPNSLIDQMRKVYDFRQEYEGDPALFREALDPELRWVVDENIDVHYWAAINEDKSLWPERWSIDELNQERHTRSFAKNMMNKPVSLDGGYWQEEDIDIDIPEEFGNTILSIDPAVTTKKKSDFTGFAVVSRGSDGKLYVRHAEQVKGSGDVVKEKAEQLINIFDAKVVYVETNQGGDLWKQVFSGVPAKFKAVRQTEKKEIRAAKAHDHYKKGKVKHVAHFPILEEQMLAFPKVTHDDVLDAVVSGVLYFTAPSTKVTARQFKYMEV